MCPYYRPLEYERVYLPLDILSLPYSCWHDLLDSNPLCISYLRILTAGIALNISLALFWFLSYFQPRRTFSITAHCRPAGWGSFISSFMMRQARPWKYRFSRRANKRLSKLYKKWLAWDPRLISLEFQPSKLEALRQCWFNVLPASLGGCLMFDGLWWIEQGVDPHCSQCLTDEATVVQNIGISSLPF